MLEDKHIEAVVMAVTTQCWAGTVWKAGHSKVERHAFQVSYLFR